MNKSSKSSIPASWTLTTVGDVCLDIISGSGFPKKYQGKRSGKYPFAKVGDISKCFRSGKKRISWADHYIEESVRKEIKAKVFQEGAIVFPKIGEALKNNYRVITDTEMIFDNNVMGVVPYETVIDTSFLFYFLTTKDFGELSVATAVPSVRRGDIESIEIALPPFNEQVGIVAKIEELFSELDKGIESLKTAREQLKVYRQSILKHAFEGKLTADWRQKKCVEIDSWRSVNVGELAVSGPSNGKSVKDRVGGFPVLRLTSLKGGKVDLAECKEGAWTENEASSYIVEGGDFLLSRGNGSKRLVGRGGLVPKSARKIAFPDTIVRIRLNETIVDPQFFAYIWESRLVRDQIEAAARTTAGIYKINQQHIKNFTVTLPHKSEQIAIVQTLDEKLPSIDSSIANIDQQVLSSNLLRQSILKEAFSGKLVAQDPNDEPASVLLERTKAEKEKNNKKKKGKAA